MAISRMQQPRQMYNRGMMVHDPRQAYGLGGFIKKAVRGVKKIVKSPLGKAALIGLGGAGLMGMGPLGGMLGGTGASIGRGLGALRSGAGSMFTGAGKGLGKGGMFSSVGNLFKVGGKEDGALSIPRMLMGGLGATALAMPFLGGKEEEEVAEEQMDPAYQTQRARDYYSQTGTKGVGLDFMPDKKYVNQNFYAADGGRAGYAMGGQIDEDEEDFIRSGAGQSRRQPMAFLAMGGDAGNAQAEQMLMAEFVKYKNKGGDLSFNIRLKQLVSVIHLNIIGREFHAIGAWLEKRLSSTLDLLFFGTFNMRWSPDLFDLVMVFESSVSTTATSSNAFR